MDIKNKPLSFFSLFFHSLKVANQVFGSVLALCLIILLISALIIAIVIGGAFLWGPKVLLPLMILASLLMSFLNMLFSTATIQIVAAKIEKRGFSAWEGLTGSIVPTFYIILSVLIITIPTQILLFAAKLSHSDIIVALCSIALIFAVLPFCFTMQAIALREEGPISALRYSWDLACKHYGRILLIFFGFTLFFIFIMLATVCVIKAFFPTLLLMLMSKLNASILMGYPGHAIIGALILFYALLLYLYLVIQVAWTGLFLNLDYLSRSSLNRELESALAGDIPQTPQPAETPVMPEVMIKQASVRTDAEADPDTARHLDQVYSAQEHLARALEQEEDRMPTILFDEDMAKQLAENEEKMRQHKEQAAQRKDEEDQQSIKISDKPL